MSWQKWSDVRFREFLKEYYGDMIELAKEITKGESGSLKVAVFDKIATPAVYLKPFYDAWLKKREAKEADEICDEVLHK